MISKVSNATKKVKRHELVLSDGRINQINIDKKTLLIVSRKERTVDIPSERLHEVYDEIIVKVYTDDYGSDLNLYSPHNGIIKDAFVFPTTNDEFVIIGFKLNPDEGWIEV